MIVHDRPETVNEAAYAAAPEKCPRCGPFAPRLVWQRFRNGTRHVRCECRFCGGFVTYVPQTAATILQADRDTSRETLRALFDAEGAE